ncbi:MAG: hypothetical protein K9G60_15425, partial [Pseudolabrys sp.]|nr:hypothetical protein [Pseudolabrys sp.]
PEVPDFSGEFALRTRIPAVPGRPGGKRYDVMADRPPMRRRNSKIGTDSRFRLFKRLCAGASLLCFDGGN